MEQSGTYANWQVALKFSALNCIEMHEVREIEVYLQNRVTAT